MKTKADIETTPAMFSGYASLFSLVDLSGDIIEPGAFSASLRRGGSIRMLWQHQADNPIGIWTKLTEDQRGLYVEGQLAQGVARADEAWQLISKGALDGLSIGFRTIRSKKASGSGKRHILEADLWEISLVTFPMLPQARVSGINKDARVSGIDGKARVSGICKNTHVSAVHMKNNSEISDAQIIRQATSRLLINTGF